MKFELEELLALMDRVDQTGIASFEYKNQEVKVKICGANSVQVQPVQAWNPVQPVQVSVPAEPMPGTNPVQAAQHTDVSGKANGAGTEEGGTYVESPMVGTFYAAPSQDAQPFVQVGDHVKKGQTIGIVEAMKLMNEIEAECDGIVREILVKNEQMVEYGQKLIRIAAE